MMICRSSPIVLRTNSSTLAISLLGLFDARAAGRPGVDLERARIDLGEKLAAQPRPQPGERRHEQPDGDQHDGEPIVHRAIELADVPANPGLDQGLPAGEQAAQQTAASGSPLIVRSASDPVDHDRRRVRFRRRFVLVPARAA